MKGPHRRRGATVIEIVLAALLLAAGGVGAWQLNRPLPAAHELLLAAPPEGAVVLDARGSLAYRRGHLPGALRLWARDLLAFEGEVPGMLAAPDVIADRLRSLGLGADATVVVYDDGGQDAPLVTLVLRSFGLDAYLLEGGLEGWLARGGTLTTVATSPPEPGLETLGFDPRLLVAADETRQHIDENAVAPVDTREAFAYGVGHIDGAVNLAASQLLPNGSLPRWSDLDRLLQAARLTRDTHPIIYGASVAEAAQAWLVLASYGIEHLHVYAGPYQGLVVAGLPISQSVSLAANSTRSSSVCWQ